MDLSVLTSSSHLPDNRVAITLHFLLHGIHHYLPMDRYRLVMPPTLFAVLAAPFWKFAHAIIFWNWYAALAAYCGGIFGYTCYDMTHYFLHHQKYVYPYITMKDLADKLKATSLLPATQEVSPCAPLRRLPKRFRCHQPLLGPHLRHRA